MSFHTHVAKLSAVIAFALVLGALGLGLWRTRKQLQTDEVEATLEADFQRLERELSGEVSDVSAPRSE